MVSKTLRDKNFYFYFITAENLSNMAFNIFIFIDSENENQELTKIS